MGVSTSHPNASGLNIGGGGINMGGSGISNCTGISGSGTIEIGSSINVLGNLASNGDTGKTFTLTSVTGKLTVASTYIEWQDIDIGFTNGLATYVGSWSEVHRVPIG